MQAAEVEEDAAVEQRLRVAAVDPVGEQPRPVRERAAPLRIARHDAALAQRKAGERQPLVDRIGKAQHRVAIDRFAVDQPVVLVGGDRLLAAAFAAEREPAPAGRRNVQASRLDLQQALRQPVVEVADESRHLFGSDALRDEMVRQAPYVRRDGGERGGVPCPMQRFGDPRDRQSLQGEQVAFADDADHALDAVRALHDGDMANAVLGHQQARIRRGLRRVERPHTARHHGGHRRIERHAGQDHASDQVGARQDADRLLAAIVALDHDDRTDVQGMHALEHLAQRLVRCAGQRRAARQLSQRGAHGALDARFVRIARLQLLPRQVQQGAEAALAEVEKHLAAPRELLELGALQSQAEGVANGDDTGG